MGITENMVRESAESAAERIAAAWTAEEVPTVELTRTTLRDALAEAFAREWSLQPTPGSKHYRLADLALDTLATFATREA